MLVGIGASQRGMIEAALTEGIVVVHYEGCDVRPVVCSVTGEYRPVSITAAQDSTWMQDESKLGATVPLSAVELAGEFSRDRLFRLDYVVVGQSRATVRDLERASLSGSQCADATHWVRAAMRGASTLLSQSATKFRAGFKAPWNIGAEAQHSSQGRQEKINGQIDQCSMTGEAHGAQCNALIQLDLVPLEEPPDRTGCAPAIPGGAETVEGELAASDTALPGGGFGDEWMVQAASGRPLRIALESDAVDAYLLVVSPSGRQFENDDLSSGCRNSVVEIGSAEGGTYVVTVTSYERDQPGAYRLGAVGGTIGRPRDGDAPENVPPPDPPTASHFGTIALRAGFTPDPHETSGTSGGMVQARGWSRACAGFVTSKADHLLDLQTDFEFLRLYARSSGDVTLVVRTPAGAFLCADDVSNENRNAAIEGAFSAGTYQVWIGSYAAGESGAYSLSLSELNRPE